MSTRSSSFADNYVQSLLSTAQSSSKLCSFNEEAIVANETEDLARDQRLENLLVQLKSPANRDTLRSVVKELLETDSSSGTLTRADNNAVRAAVETRVVVGIYAEALDQWLQEAIELDSEAEWWDNVGRTNVSVLSYLLASERLFFIVSNRRLIIVCSPPRTPQTQHRHHCLRLSQPKYPHSPLLIQCTNLQATLPECRLFPSIRAPNLFFSAPCPTTTFLLPLATRVNPSRVRKEERETCRAER